MLLQFCRDLARYKPFHRFIEPIMFFFKFENPTSFIAQKPIPSDECSGVPYMNSR